MSLLEKLSLESLGPASLWAALDPELRRLAGRSVYEPGWDDRATREEADEAIAAALRFRKVMVRKMPHAKRVEYLVRTVRPDDSLATGLLQALHLGQRRPMLVAFLDDLGIAHDGGVIDEDRESPPLTPETLRAAVERLLREFPRDDVELYLASLLAIDDRTWGPLREVLPAVA